MVSCLCQAIRPALYITGNRRYSTDVIDGQLLYYEYVLTFMSTSVLAYSGAQVVVAVGIGRAGVKQPMAWTSWVVVGVLWIGEVARFSEHDTSNVYPLCCRNAA